MSVVFDVTTGDFVLAFSRCFYYITVLNSYKYHPERANFEYFIHYYTFSIIAQGG